MTALEHIDKQIRADERLIELWGKFNIQHEIAPGSFQTFVPNIAAKRLVTFRAIRSRLMHGA